MAVLHIVRASAGSGKTFRLTLEYLSYLYDNTDNFRHILAVTFTNKATEEMKSRITGVLHELATGKQSHYLNPLLGITGKTEKEIRLKSDIILRKILHNYSRFSVSTIDSFFQYIIRSFTREIGIQSGYTLELDDNLVLNKAVDDMFQRIDNDKTLREWLIEFTQMRIEGSKSWNLKGKIFELGGEIFKENYKKFSDSIAGKLQDKDFLSRYKSELYAILKSFESALQKYGIQAVEIMLQNHLEVDDFYQKSKGPAGFLQKLADGKIPEINSYTREVLQDINKWSKRDNSKWPAIRQVCETDLHSLLQVTTDFYLKSYAEYKTADTILKNFYTLGILTDITSSVYAHTRDKNLFLISDSARFINRIIDNNDTPFIYEKTGNYFHHFLIDEFQDTSGFQWKNFKPLISNSLSQDFNCLIVGDVKQSIYRWRNSNWEILSKEILTDFYREALQTETLEVNRRSKKHLVEFNNRFFSAAAGIMQNQYNSESGACNNSPGEIINELYTDVIQKLPGPPPAGGHVKMHFVNSEVEYNGYVFSRVVELIKKLQDLGYSPADMAILTRGKKEGKEIADYLMEYSQNQKPESRYNFDVISEESLFIDSSAVVRFIISIFRYIVEPENHINNYFMLFEYLNYFKNLSTAGNFALIPSYTPQTSEETIKSIMPAEFIRITESHINSSIYETLQAITRIFLLNNAAGEQSYLQALKDMVIDYTGRNSSSLAAFLDYWDVTGSLKAISGAENQDAIRLLTIHKSKGLEFKVVIMPFCNWKINPRPGYIIWCNPDQSPFNQLETLPVNYNESLKDTHFADDYLNEKLKIYIDNINLLYVAFTRAKEALYCFAPVDERKTDSGITNISHLIGKTLNRLENDRNENLKVLQGEDLIIESGQMQTTEQKDEPSVKTVKMQCVPENNTIERMRISYHAKEYLATEDDGFLPLSYGKIMHELFSQIITLNDIEPAVDALYYQGKINQAEMGIIRKDIRTLFSDIQVNSWFTGEWKVLNERDILFTSHQNKRPDRVLIKGKSAIIIDYKFGDKELNEHREQVNEYGDLIRQMGFEKVETYLWYISKNKVLQVG